MKGFSPHPAPFLLSLSRKSDNSILKRECCVFSIGKISGRVYVALDLHFVSVGFIKIYVPHIVRVEVTITLPFVGISVEDSV
ncbi:MAG: hypothetical protein II338_02965, partial [Bacteroidaceae bacterium]|nr:hypothetical protein [Bacteroidaceae bacterium]